MWSWGKGTDKPREKHRAEQIHMTVCAVQISTLAQELGHGEAVYWLYVVVVGRGGQTHRSKHHIYGHPLSLPLPVSILTRPHHHIMCGGVRARCFL